MVLVLFLKRPLVARTEEELETVDADRELCIEEASDDTAPLVVEEYGCPEDTAAAANLGCLRKCCSAGLLVPSVLCSVNTRLFIFWGSSFTEDLSGGFLLGCGAMRG